MRPAAGRRYSDDEGLTLIEMVIAFLILGVIMVPLTSSFMLGISSTQRTGQTVSDSADAQLFGSYFVDDVTSADSMTNETGCGGPGTALQLDWVDGSLRKYAAYRITENTAAESELHVAPIYRIDRVYCESAAATTTPGAPIATTLVARSAKAPGLAVSCVPGPCPTTRTNPQPRSISVDVTEYGRTAIDPTYSFTLTATRRVTS